MDNSNIEFYYSYVITVFDSIDCTHEQRTGIILAVSLSEAVKVLEDFYGEDDIESIESLKLLFDGRVFDFKIAMEDTDFNYNIVKKNNSEE